MKRLKTILLLVAITLMLGALNVYAAEPSLTITGENEVEAGQTKKLTVVLASDTEQIGVISAKIELNTNVENIQLTGQNGWQLLSYNDANGEFKLVKAAGANNEAAMEISYTVKADATGSASITLSNIILTTTEYTSKTVQNLTKEITISAGTPEPTTKTLNSISVTTKPSKVSYTEGESFNKTGMVVTANYSDGTSSEVTNYTYTPNGALKETDTKITITYTEGSITKTAEQEIKVAKADDVINNTINNENNIVNGNLVQKDPTVANKVISQTGITNYVIGVIVAIAVIGTISYINYKKYKEI